MFDDFKPTKEEFERVGIKPVFPLLPGKVVSPVLDPVFKNLANDKHTKKFLAKIISLVTKIDYDYLVKNIVVASNNTQEGNAFIHHNEQDVVVSFDGLRINIEMSINNKFENIRKNQITAFKYDSNLFKVGDNYKLPRKFIQICIENYSAFNNNLLITESKIVDVSSGNYEVLNDEFIQYHVNLKNVSNACYNNLDELERYFKFFLLDDEKELYELSGEDEIMKDAVDKLKSMSSDPNIISEIEKKQIEEYCRMISLEDELEKGKQIGFSKGKQIGETKKQVEIAKNSLKQGLDIQVVSTITGLSIDEVKKLT